MGSAVMMWYVLPAANLAISLETAQHKQRGNRALGLPKGQAVPFILEAVAQASAIANNEVTNPDFVNNSTVSNIRFSNLCHRNCES